MAGDAHGRWLARFRETGDIHPVRLGMSREELIVVLGEPDDTGAASRRRRTPAILVYGSLEFHFGTSVGDGLVCIYEDDPSGTVKTCIGGGPG